jgi:hypothetical protein
MADAYPYEIVVRTLRDRGFAVEVSPPGPEATFVTLEEGCRLAVFVSEEAALSFANRFPGQPDLMVRKRNVIAQPFSSEAGVPSAVLDALDELD